MLEITHRQKIKLKENNSSSLKRHIFSFRNEFPSAFKEQHVFPLLGITAKPRTIKQQSQRQEQRASEAAWQRLGLGPSFISLCDSGSSAVPCCAGSTPLPPSAARSSWLRCYGWGCGKMRRKRQGKEENSTVGPAGKARHFPWAQLVWWNYSWFVKAEGKGACSWHRWCSYWCSFSKHCTQHKTALQKQTPECSLTEPGWRIPLHVEISCKVPASELFWHLKYQTTSSLWGKKESGLRSKQNFIPQHWLVLIQIPSGFFPQVPLRITVLWVT